MPGQTPGTIGISAGYGRAKNGEAIGKPAFQCDEFGNHLEDENGNLIPVGGNAFNFVTYSDKSFKYSNNVEVVPTDEKYALACTQTHHTIMGRTSIVKETTYDFWKDNHESNQEAYNPKIKLHSHAEGGHSEVNATEYSLWDEHPVEKVGHRWGMSIDLSSCNGCGVCITACHSENNVPVVGKDEVRRSRDMHWLRMDRYFSSIEDDNRKEWENSKKVEGDFDYGKLEVPEENPSVVFMPMLCQHCNHAPCETVCPVAATTHSNEGLNMMTYNRCIGTRYCANNCPYKVRRFNWFNYRDYRKFKNFNPTQDQMARMVLNPDVVVRSRGVMEKCSFCVQRIQAGKLTAKKESRAVVDGDVTTACSDACPNNCITFGDWNDNESKIREVSKSDRSYQALEEVGVKPNIWYQLKVRNIEEEVAVNTVSEESHSEHH
jgi:Fe-S-cluster-containing dehydrogenase component